MSICATCGNEYDKPIEIKQGGQTYVFDSFACAIHRLAPRCAHCGVTVIGHGLEAGIKMFCCAHCARQHGEHRLEDRV